MVSCWDRKCHVSTGIYLFGCSIFMHPYISSWLSYIYIQNKTHTLSSHKGKQPMSHPAKVFSRVLKPLLPALNLEYMLGGGCLVPKSCPTLATPRTIACQALLFMGFSRQEYWSELPFPSPGNLPNPGIEPRSPALQADSLLTELR